jgi:hypothetical protein
MFMPAEVQAAAEQKFRYYGHFTEQVLQAAQIAVVTVEQDADASALLLSISSNPVAATPVDLAAQGEKVREMEREYAVLFIGICKLDTRSFRFSPKRFFCWT